MYVYFRPFCILIISLMVDGTHTKQIRNQFRARTEIMPWKLHDTRNAKIAVTPMQLQLWGWIACAIISRTNAIGFFAALYFRSLFFQWSRKGIVWGWLWTLVVWYMYVENSFGLDLIITNKFGMIWRRSLFHLIISASEAHNCSMYYMCVRKLFVIKSIMSQLALSWSMNEWKFYNNK